MKKLILGFTLFTFIAIQSNAQEVVIIKQKSKDSASKPLIVINGVVAENKNMNEIAPNDIQSMNVIKGPTAAEKYGKKGEKGVVEITIKKKAGLNIDTPTNMNITINGDEIMLNGEKINANDPRLKKVKRMQLLKDHVPPPPSPAPMNKAFLGVISKASEEGAQVVSVSPESPAAKAGLKEDDIITKINNQTIDGPDALFEQIGKYKPEDKITVEFLREGKKNKKEIALAKNKWPAISKADRPGQNWDEDVEVFNFDKNNFNKNFNENFKRGFRLPELPNLERIDVMTNKPKLGISIEDREEGNGVIIKSVTPASPAEKAGLKQGDIITLLNTHEIREVNDIKWEFFEPGQIIKLGVLRNKETKTIEVKIPKKIHSADL